MEMFQAMQQQSHRIIRRLACSVLASFPLNGLGQQPPRPPETISLSGQVELARMLDLSAERLGIRIDYDPALLKGAVAIRSVDGLTPGQLWEFTNQALAQRGFTTVRASGAEGYSVVRVTDAAQVSMIGDDQAGVLPGYMTRMLEAKNRPAKDIVEIIRPLLSKAGASAGVMGDSRFMLVSDLTPRLGQIETIIAMLDAAGEAIVLEEYLAQRVVPAALVTAAVQVSTKQGAASGSKLPGELFAAPGAGTVIILAPRERMADWRELLAKLDKGAPLETRDYVPKRFGVAEVAKLVREVIATESGTDIDRASVVMDELTGTLIVTAAPAVLRRVDALMERLDASDAAAARRMRAFPIRNRSAAEVRAMLMQLIDAGVLDMAESTDSRRSVAEAARQQTTRAEDIVPIGGGGADPLLGPRGSGVRASSAAEGSGPHAAVTPTALSLTADEATNTLIAVGDARLIEQMEGLLRVLDVSQPQVMLEVMLVSINDSDSMNLGVELEKLGNIGDAAYRIASLFGLSTGAAGIRVPTESQGFTGAVLNPGDFSVVVKAIETINKGRSLSRPRLLVINNEQATFSSVLQQPVLTTSTSNTSTISSFGGTEDAGTTISVKPQIAQGDHLILTYSINLSSFVGTSAGAGLPPPKQQNGVDSVATIPDGHVVVVGGLELFSDSKGTSQIPGLGDIPLLGEAFKNRTKNVSRTRFYVFIKASVLRNQRLEDLKYLSTIDAASMSVSDGFPVVKPRIIR